MAAIDSTRDLSLKDAMELVDDDLPDGAYWAMAHQMAGADYGEAWGELDGDKPKRRKAQPTTCPICKKPFERNAFMRQHYAAKHPGAKPLRK